MIIHGKKLLLVIFEMKRIGEAKKPFYFLFYGLEKMQKNFLFFLFFFPVASLLAQTAPVPQVKDLPPLRMSREPNPVQPIPELKVPIEKFFNQLLQGDIQRAFQELLVNSRLASRNENINMLMDKTSQAMSYYGKADSFDIYDSKAFGNRLYVVTYLLNLELQPLRWRFVYYKPDKVWKLIDIRVDDALEDLINK
ncbi:hypothetical protein A7Q09_00420 [Methylacidiphilum sp. Yel]|jgi:hypothetical protein|uniref:hypothetical protein n=1 Tax=Methylacidiphilum sp. Yel TaxID=1847730 RepID=UPI00106AEE22|nr:hypothetical protein [Methylacidiphilum sp. Yel]TFE69863.1 hypothetical protein A7Q09_00420 [Methylacidiphilum sp. Yel]